MDEFPSGMNMIVAVLAYTGDNLPSLLSTTFSLHHHSLERLLCTLRAHSTHVEATMQSASPADGVIQTGLCDIGRI